MSNDSEVSAKKMRLDISTVSAESADVGVESQTKLADDGSIPGGFRDLIFAVTGTVPQSFDSVNTSTSCELLGSGTTGFNSCDKKHKSASVAKCREEDDRSTRGSICYSTGNKEKSEHKSEEVQALLSEADVGITEFISSHEGFSGILKQR
jgi:hypothetical protein